ncbi:MAG: hypothetical protein R2750_02000 [Bacteroidales bacterium]
MEPRVLKIHLSADCCHEKDIDSCQGNTDVIVYLENGKKYIASFFTYTNIHDMHMRHKQNGDYLNGAYFWDKNMVLVENCSLKDIEPIVNDLIDEGNFREAFSEL